MFILLSVIFQALCDALQCPIHIVQLIDSPFSDRMMTHLGAKNVVVSDLNPRPLPDSLRGALVRIQVPRRELWLSLHGEAHFRSLHCFSATKEVRNPNGQRGLIASYLFCGLRPCMVPCVHPSGIPGDFYGREPAGAVESSLA